MTRLATHRIPAIDLARGIALIAMAIFHFGWDLENFELARKAMTLEPQWKYFARVIASSFLFLVGVSAWLAHHNRIKYPTLFKRIAMVGCAALLISVATYFATPKGFIFFGILHNITLSSLLILVMLRWPIWLITSTAFIVLSAPLWARSELLDHPLWWWSGLSQLTPKANDYVPIFPWFGWVILGLGAAKLFQNRNWWRPISRFEFSSRVGRLLRVLGQHSMIFYLVHQPIMIGLIYVWVKFTADI